MNIPAPIRDRATRLTTVTTQRLAAADTWIQNYQGEVSAVMIFSELWPFIKRHWKLLAVIAFIEFLIHANALIHIGEITSWYQAIPFLPH